MKVLYVAKLVILCLSLMCIALLMSAQSQSSAGELGPVILSTRVVVERAPKSHSPCLFPYSTIPIRHCLSLRPPSVSAPSVGLPAAP